MCGAFGLEYIFDIGLAERYSFTSSEKMLADIEAFRFNPHSEIPTVSRNSPNKLVMRYWSIIPPWIQDPKDLKYPTFNARSETLREKPTYKPAWDKGQRCLIIATQFYEWHRVYDKTGKKVLQRTPYTFRVRGEKTFAMAGLWSTWKDFECTTVITTEANKEMAPIHDRSPVILTKEQEEVWLSHETLLDDAYALLKPPKDGTLELCEGLQSSPCNPSTTQG